MVTSTYIPERGDIVWIDFNPTKGHEQAGRRPALVLSRKIYNIKSERAVVCPITSSINNYPFEVLISGSKKTNGAILVDQIRSIDWKARKTTFIEKISTIALEEVTGKLSALLADDR